MMVERHLPTVGIAQMLENGLLEVGLFLLGSLYGILELLRDSFSAAGSAIIAGADPTIAARATRSM